jgi:hypothetical protein
LHQEGESMKFKDKFKPGDIICSDRFHNGLCMIVDYLNEDYFSGMDLDDISQIRKGAEHFLD